MVPFPAFRMPWISVHARGKQFSLWDKFNMFMAHLCGVGMYEVEQVVLVKHQQLGRLKMWLFGVFLGVYLFRAIVLEKKYLELTKIGGFARLQVQQPVKHCNPINPHCESNFTDAHHLRYCQQYTGKEEKALVQHPCKYRDQFDMASDSSLHQQHDLMLVTRRTFIDQKPRCHTNTSKEGDCRDTYSSTKTQNTFFMADIESFTLQFDHSFVAEEEHLKSKSLDMVGFYNPCLHEMGEEEELIPLDDKMGSILKHSKAHVRNCDHDKEGPEECELEAIKLSPKMYADGKGKETKSRVKKEVEKTTIDMWTEHWLVDLIPPIRWLGLSGAFQKKKAKEGHMFTKIPSGDVVKLGDILEELHLDLDETIEGRNTTLREEGFVLIVEIRYTNFKKGTWPNPLPPVYTYHFMKAPATEYKSEGPPTFDKDGNRILEIKHGILVKIQQRGVVGRFSKKETLLIFLEGIVVYAFASWILTCFSLNFGTSQFQDKLERKIVDYFDHP